MLRHLFRLLLLWCCIAPALGGCAALAGIEPEYYKVRLNSVSLDHYIDIYSGIVFKTRFCPRVAIMEEAIFEMRIFGGTLHFKDGYSCIVVF